MAMTDPLGDMLTRIRNGQQARKDSILTPASKLRAHVLDVLQREGYIRGYSEEPVAGQKGLRIELKYFEGQPAIQHLVRVSKPGRRVYSAARELPRRPREALPPSRKSLLEQRTDPPPDKVARQRLVCVALVLDPSEPLAARIRFDLTACRVEQRTQ